MTILHAAAVDARIRETAALLALGTTIPLDRPAHRENLAALAELILIHLNTREGL